ncbi:MAG: hypothetical protein HOW73_00220 [Polyangiaceae bacterium]|nr:hypothetical protein [Polyangiaceae bacterium]
MAGRTILFSAVAVIVVACGSEVQDGPDGGGGSGASTGGSTNDTGGNDGGGGTITGDACEGLSCGDPCSTCPDGAPCVEQACSANGECVELSSVTCSPCPSEPPPDNEACEPFNLQCEYDDGIVLACRTRTTCTAEGWKTFAVDCDSDPPPDPSCPATQPSGDCTKNDPELCVYDGDTPCACTNCGAGPCGGPESWVCAPPPPAPCPPIAPALGAPCDAGNDLCIYGSCGIGGVHGGRKCLDGIWTEEIVACPL